MKRLMFPALFWVTVLLTLVTATRCAAVYEAVNHHEFFQSITLSYSHTSYQEEARQVSMTITLDRTTNTVYWSRSQNTSCGYWIAPATALDGGYVSPPIFDVSPTSPENGVTGSFTAGAGTWYQCAVRASFQDPPGTFVVHDEIAYFSFRCHAQMNLPANNTGRDRTYKLIQSGQDVAGSITIQGNGAPEKIVLVSTPSCDPVTLVVLDDGIAQDGPTWVVADPGTPVTTTLAVSDVLDEASANSISGADTPNSPPHDGGPTANENQIWTPEEGVKVNDPNHTSDFTVKAYREGVDRIVAKLQKLVDKPVPDNTVIEEKLATLHDDVKATTLTPANVTLPTLAGVDDFGKVSSGVLPSTAPTFFSGTLSTSAHSVTVNLPTFTILTRQWPEHSFTLDFVTYSDAITYFRGFLVVVLWIGYFLLIVRTVKGMGASET